MTLDVKTRKKTSCDTHLELIFRINMFRAVVSYQVAALLRICLEKLRSGAGICRSHLVPSEVKEVSEVSEVREVREGFLLPVLQRQSCFVSVSEVSDTQQQNQANVGKLQQTAEQCEWLCGQQRHWMFSFRR